MITLTYQFKLKLTHQQTQEIESILEVFQGVYNYALAAGKYWLNSCKSPVNACSIISEDIIPADTPYLSYIHQVKQVKVLTVAQQSDQNLKSVNVQVLRQTLKILDRFLSEMKAKACGVLRFKKTMRSFVCPVVLKNCLGNCLSNCLGKGKVKLPQLGWVKIWQSREYLIESRHIENCDTACAKVIEYRGKIAVGQPVIQNVCGGILTGAATSIVGSS